MEVLPYLLPSPLELLHETVFENAGVKLYLKRDELLDPVISGNKWRKLKYNLHEARQQGFDTLITLGGAYSNHLYATAAAGKRFDFKTIGIVRGQEHQPSSNPTLRFCNECGMKLLFVSRQAYRSPEVLRHRYGNGCYWLPEGGTNHLAYKGLGELMDEVYTQVNPDFVCVPVGTGGTATGVCTAARGMTKVLGFSILRDGNGFDLAHVERLFGRQFGDWDLMLEANQSPRGVWIGNYHFGGYAKVKPELLAFMEQFEAQHGILIEQVYTAKMLYGIYDMIRQGWFKPNTCIVAVHTGGLQGRVSSP